VSPRSGCRGYPGPPYVWVVWDIGDVVLVSSLCGALVVRVIWVAGSGVRVVPIVKIWLIMRGIADFRIVPYIPVMPAHLWA